jgi:hypothetical protein
MLKGSIMSEYVMLNLVLNSFQYRFSISTKYANQGTLNQVQGDKREPIWQPGKSEVRSFRSEMNWKGG